MWCPGILFTAGSSSGKRNGTQTLFTTGILRKNSIIRRIRKSFSLPGKSLHPFIILASCTAVLVQCDFVYSPEPAYSVVTSDNTTDNSSIDAGTVYPVNGSRQICNPSMAPGGPYNGCMLWLNFGGDLNVRVPSGMSGYASDREHVHQHDRLTVSDTANTVRWFMMRDELGVAGQLQDPEWSTDADYVICLGDRNKDGKWSIYVIRLSDREFLRVGDNNVQELSTPHLWIAPSAISGGSAAAPSYPAGRGGFADSVSVNSFFGTDSVIISWAFEKNGILALNYIDYAAAEVNPVSLPKPDGRGDWDCESPLISPDGQWILFNCLRQGSYESYLQRLDQRTSPILLAANAVDPHWWIHPEFMTVNVVYATLKGDYFVKEEYTDPSLSNGAIGTTCKQEIRIASGNLPNHASYSAVGRPSLIVNLPFKGGMSADGRFIGTGYGYGFILSLF